MGFPVGDVVAVVVDCGRVQVLLGYPFPVFIMVPDLVLYVIVAYAVFTIRPVLTVLFFSRLWELFVFYAVRSSFLSSLGKACDCLTPVLSVIVAGVLQRALCRFASRMESWSINLCGSMLSCFSILG